MTLIHSLQQKNEVGILNEIVSKKVFSKLLRLFLNIKNDFKTGGENFHKYSFVAKNVFA